MRIATISFNPVLGDIDGNLARMLAHLRALAQDPAPPDLVIFPEMALTGYMLGDLIDHPQFVRRAHACLRQFVAASAAWTFPVVFGAPYWPWLPALDGDEEADEFLRALDTALVARHRAEGAQKTTPLLPLGDRGRGEEGRYNAAFVLNGGRVHAVVRKQELPYLGVFDEPRNFDSAPPQGPVDIAGTRWGIMVCQDFWHDDPPETHAETGAEVLLAINASPWFVGHASNRRVRAATLARRFGLPVLYVNLLGGQDDEVYDGGGFAVDRAGRLVWETPPLREQVAWITLQDDWDVAASSPAMAHGADEADEAGMIYQIVVLGLRDYVRKSGFERVVLGLSGGIDSALVCAMAADALAADALGADAVHAVYMPSPYSADMSGEDAEALATALGCRYDVVPIHDQVSAIDRMLGAIAVDLTHPSTVPHENLQARMRGMLLMAIANAHHAMVLATSNKSESAMGYATLYGDMCGGYAPLKDLSKLRVQELAQWRNAQRTPADLGLAPVCAPIPRRILTRPPSAELRPNQVDSDSLLPYPELDPLLAHLIEFETPFAALDAADQAHAAEIWGAVLRTEYKRRQAAPGPKITGKSFGHDRRYPLVNRFEPD